MKVLVPSNTISSRDVYELMRLRKSLKGACEVANISYVTNSLNDYDLVHVLSLNQDLIINDAIDNNKPIVISALMAESDPSGRMTITTKKGTHLKPKAIKTLNQATLVFVPNLSCKEFLIEEGIKTRIEILSSGINMSRFVSINDIERTLFRKYFSIQPSQKTILCIGQYDDKNEQTQIIEIAKRLPEFTFVYIGKSKFGNLIEFLINKLVKRAPKNLIFSDIVDDDVYRSAMVNADIYLSLKDIKFDSVTMLEAMASNTRVVSFNQNSKANEYDKHVLSAKTIDEVCILIKDEILHPDEKELSSAMEFAKQHSLKNISQTLKKHYEELLK